MLELYYKNKLKYNNYIVFIKVGNFYECLSKDALIINKIFNYKIKKISNTIKVGFPISNIKYITGKIKDNNINYVVIDKDNIIDINEVDNNDYINYNFDIDNILYNYIRIEKIIKYLNDFIMNKEFCYKLDKIEEIIKD